MNLQHALDLFDAGVHVIPVGTNKVPALEWRTYIEKGVTRQDVERWFSQPAGIGRLCGSVSGNLEVIDFDVDSEVDSALFALSSTELLKEWGKLVEEQAPGLRGKLCLIQTPRPGWHVSYRCENPIGGNAKLAYVKGVSGKWKSIIETRGEGGYALCPHSPVWCHPSGGDRYEHVAGPALTNLQVITEQERSVLLQAARSFTLKPEKCEAETKAVRTTRIAVTGGVANDLSPGDDFNLRASWADILLPHSFELIHSDEQGVAYWRRPGSSSKWSASTNHNGSGLFYAWSPNCGVEPDRGYSKFAIYTHFNHAGDFTASTRDLGQRGFGKKDLSHIDLTAFLSDTKQPALPVVETDEPFPEELLSVPGIIAGMTGHMNSTALIQQPVLSLAAAVSFMGALIGRKVTDSIGSRPNLYCVGLCRSGGGKDHARKVNKDFAAKAGALKLIGPEGAASGSGLISAVAQSPSLLFQFDEIGRLLRTVGNPSSAPHLYQIVTVLMKLFSSSNTTFQGDAYADAKKNVAIDCPNVNVYGTTVPQSMFESLTHESLTDGFVSRLLIFEGDDSAGPQRPARPEMPEETLAMIRAWNEFERSHFGEIWSDPLEVPYTQQADDHMWSYLQETLAGKPNHIEQSLWSRAHEKARKLALIHACSESFESPSVDLDTAEWATQLSSYLTRRTVVLAGRHVNENVNEKNWKRVEELIQANGTIKATDLHNKTRFLKPHERTSALKEMEDKGLILSVTTVPEGRGRPCKFYQWVGNEP